MKHIIIHTLYIFTIASLLFSCKSAKLSDAEEKHRIGEYYEAAAIYRRVYTKTSPKKRDLRGYIAFRMAECNRLINSTPKALSGYMNALRYDHPDSSNLQPQSQGLTPGRATCPTAPHFLWQQTSDSFLALQIRAILH